MIKKCLYCDSVIIVKPSQFERKKYCSRSCKTAYQEANPPEFWNELRKKVTLICDYCSNEFTKKPSEIRAKDFCSKACWHYYQIKNRDRINQHLKRQITKECQVCSTLYTIPEYRSKSSKYCSMHCLGIANGLRGRIQYTKQRSVYCSNCGKLETRKPSVIRTHNFCSVDCMAKYYSKTKMFSGVNSPTWCGGDINYYGPNWLSQRRIARERDNYTCQDCGQSEKEYGRELSVHHITPFREFNGDWESANKLSNLISLCEYPCHRKRHSKNTQLKI